eukprot:849949-Pelagomonas_calceolata.AAC.1
MDRVSQGGKCSNMKSGRGRMHYQRQCHKLTVSLPLLECHKNTHKFCSGDGIRGSTAIGFYVQLQVLGGWTSVPFRLVNT